jgi:uncharacterized protein (DUF2237 family)
MGVDALIDRNTTHSDSGGQGQRLTRQSVATRLESGTLAPTMDGSGGENNPQVNVFGEPLATCSDAPKTGWYRSGCCETDAQDVGSHTVCAQMTTAFLEFSKARGNDLSTPRPEFGFPGLRDGDRWCLCAARWLEAYQADRAPKVFLKATHRRALEIVPLAALKAHALDLA